MVGLLDTCASKTKIGKDKLPEFFQPALFVVIVKANPCVDCDTAPLLIVNTKLLSVVSATVTSDAK